MTTMETITANIENEIAHTVTKIKKLMAECKGTKEQINEITNLIIIVSNLNQAYALSKTITKDEVQK